VSVKLPYTAADELNVVFEAADSDAVGCELAYTELGLDEELGGPEDAAELVGVSPLREEDAPTCGGTVVYSVNVVVPDDEDAPWVPDCAATVVKMLDTIVELVWTGA